VELIPTLALYVLLMSVPGAAEEAQQSEILLCPAAAQQ